MAREKPPRCSNDYLPFLKWKSVRGAAAARGGLRRFPVGRALGSDGSRPSPRSLPVPGFCVS